MRPYLLILGLVAATTLALAWAGQRLWNQQQAELKGRLMEEQQQALELRWRSIQAELRAREQPLIRWLLAAGKGECPEPELLRSLLLCDKDKRPVEFCDLRKASQGQAAGAGHVAVLSGLKGRNGVFDAQNILQGRYNQNLFEPDPEALALLQRSATLWQSPNPFINDNIIPDEKTLLACNPELQQQVAVYNYNLAQNKTRSKAYTNNSQKLSAPVQQEQSPPHQTLGPPAAAQEDLGCATWYAGAGLQFLYWVRLDDGGFAAAELDRDIFIQRLQERLLADPPPGLQLAFLDHGRLRGPKPSGQLLASRDLDFPFIGFSLQSWGQPDSLLAARVHSARLSLLPCFGGGLLFILVTAALLCLELRRRLHDARQRVSFVNQASHELRTPLTNIRLYAELLRESPELIEDCDRQRLAVISAESERLTRLVDNLLCFSRFERDQLTIRKRLLNPTPVLQATLESFRPLFAQKAITISADFATIAPFPHDHDALAQILANLLSNVHKYGPNHGHCALRTSVRDERNFILTLSDDGPGIPLQDQERVFTAFTRLSHRVDEGVSGTGLGLTIARQLATLQHGHLILLPSPRGCTFELSLPIIEPSANASNS